MRVYILYLVILALMIYAWRDWFVSLCGLIVLAGIAGHPDFPRFVLGIRGLNPWNVLTVGVVVPWLVNRRTEGHRWDMSGRMFVLLAGYVGVFAIAVTRAAFDFSSFPEELNMSFDAFRAEYVFDPIKYVLPAVMLYDGCRTRRRMLLALASILLLILVYCVLVIKAMPLSTLVEGGNYMRLRQRVGRRIGMHIIDVAMISVAGFWGILASLRLCTTRRTRTIALVAAAIMAFGTMLCYSRAGYLAIVVVCLAWLALRGRRRLLPGLIALAVAVVVAPIVAPTLADRVLMGIGVGDATRENATDLDVLSAGRLTNIWPPAVRQISEAPFIGFGRLGLLRGLAYEEIVFAEGKSPGHPHSAYLEMLLDSGVMGLAVTLSLLGWLLFVSARLARNRHDPLVAAIGGLSFTAVATLLVMGIACQSFFPKDEMMPLWCAWGLALRAQRTLDTAWSPRRVSATVPSLARPAWRS